MNRFDYGHTYVLQLSVEFFKVHIYMVHYKDRPELYTEFFPLQDAVFQFYSDDYFGEEDIDERAAELCAIIDEAFEKHGVRGYYENSDYLKAVVQHQLKRVTAGIRIDEYKSTQPEAPYVRIGPVDHELEPAEYEWFRDVCARQDLTTQEWITNHVSQGAWYRPMIANKHWVEFFWGSHARNDQVQHRITGEAPDFAPLVCLRKLRIDSRTPELTIYSDSLRHVAARGASLRKLSVHGDSGLQTLDISYCPTLRECDISLISVVDLSDIDLRGTKNLSFVCTEAQYGYCEVLKRSRAKKEQIPPTSKELDFYAAHYNWDREYRFLQWVIKHPKCELGTALHLYWVGLYRSGRPLDFAGKTADEIDDNHVENYKFLAEIEKRVVKKKYIRESIPIRNLVDFDDDEGENVKRLVPPELLPETYTS